MGVTWRLRCDTCKQMLICPAWSRGYAFGTSAPAHLWAARHALAVANELSGDTIFVDDRHDYMRFVVNHRDHDVRLSGEDWRELYPAMDAPPATRDLMLLEVSRSLRVTAPDRAEALLVQLEKMIPPKNDLRYLMCECGHEATTHDGKQPRRCTWESRWSGSIETCPCVAYRWRGSSEVRPVKGTTIER